MFKNLSKRKLLVISDTYVCRRKGTILAYEPVVRELNALADMFDEIVWLGCNMKADNWALSEPSMKNLKVVIMPSVHNKFMNGIRVLVAYPVFLWYVIRHIRTATHVHTRCPSHPAIIGILFSFFDRKRIYWHKYAGDWISEQLPFTYRMQRTLLKKLSFTNVKVTVNGNWPNMPKQVHAFENPCLFDKELYQAGTIASQKKYDRPLRLLFVGNLVAAKGILNLIGAIKRNDFPQVFSEIYIAGNGALAEQVKQEIAEISKVKVHLSGQLNRAALNELYDYCHVMILPSRAEGIPKVLAEAAAYGCIPVITDISAVSQYIHHGSNGYLLPDNSPESICKVLNTLVANNNLFSIGNNATKMSNKFTYEYFRKRIEHEIFSQ